MMKALSETAAIEGRATPIRLDTAPRWALLQASSHSQFCSCHSNQRGEPGTPPPGHAEMNANNVNWSK